MQVPMAVIANVTSDSLTLPASGEEADVDGSRRYPHHLPKWRWNWDGHATYADG